MKSKKHDCMIGWVSLVHAGTYFPSALSKELKREVGISLPEQDLLKQLGMAGGHLKMVDLANLVYLSKAAITKMVDRLESEGLVERRRSNVDRRVINIRITDPGKNTLTKSKKILVHWIEKNFCSHMTRGQIVDLGRSLETLLKSHDRWDGQMSHLRGKAADK